MTFLLSLLAGRESLAGYGSMTEEAVSTLGYGSIDSGASSFLDEPDIYFDFKPLFEVLVYDKLLDLALVSYLTLTSICFFNCFLPVVESLITGPCVRSGVFIPDFLLLLEISE